MTTFTVYTRNKGERTFTSVQDAYAWALSTGDEAECRDEEFNHVFTVGER